MVSVKPKWLQNLESDFDRIWARLLDFSGADAAQ
jgi:hypothetical protein